MHGRRILLTMTAGAAALCLTPAIASASPQTHPVLGRITAVNPATGSLQLSSHGQSVTLNVPSSAPVLLHEVPSSLSAAKVGMTVFANVRGTSATTVRVLQMSRHDVTTTMPVFSVDRADRIVALATSEYGPRTLILLPDGTRMANTNGVATQLSSIHKGMKVTVTGQPDTGDAYTIVGRNLSFAQ